MDRQAAEVLKQVADKLDVPVEQLWNGLVAYAPFEFYQWCAILIALAILVVVGVCIIGYDSATQERRKSEGGLGAFGLVLAAGALIMFLCVGAFEMAEALAARNAPEAWAAKKILGRVIR